MIQQGSTGRQVFFHFIRIWIWLLVPAMGIAQSKKMSDFVLFGSGSVQFSSSNILQGAGDIGSRTLIKSTGNVSFGGSLHSSGRIDLANGNQVSGSVSSGSLNLTGTVFKSGTGTIISGNLDVFGNAIIGGGSVAGNITTSGSYSGPSPQGALTQNGSPSVVSLPANPVNEVFSLAGITNDIKNSAVITPVNGTAKVRDLILGGNKTITFNGPGTYIFRSVELTNANTFRFDFNGSAEGKIKILVEGNMVLDKIGATFANGPANSTNETIAARIYTQVNGSGVNGYAFTISNGRGSSVSRWLGTLWAPNGSINIGSGTGNSNITGALWSDKNILINSGANIVYSPLAETADCSLSLVSITKINGVDVVPSGNVITGAIPCDKSEVTITTTTNIANPQYQWEAIQGYIVSGQNTSSPSISSAGTYKVTVSNAFGCSATAQVSVTSCLNRSVDEIPDKTDEVVDGVLYSFIQDPNSFKTDPGENPIVVTIGNRVLIEVILNKTQVATALTTLRGLTANGYEEIAYVDTDAEQIVTCLFNISDVLLFNTTAGYDALFDYVRPGYLPQGLQGSISSTGDQAMKSDFVRNAYNLNGSDIKVGVLSDSYDMLGGELNDIISDNLPGRNPDNTIDPVKRVKVVKEFPSALGIRSDEGRAMLQIVHDVAPGASLFFRTGFISESDFAKGIRDLAKPVSEGGHDVDIIIDDISYLTAPVFRDGIVTNAIADVTASGKKYITSAGNFGNKSYEAYFNPTNSTASRKAHNFSSSGVDSLQQLNLSKKGSYLIVLQWDDPFYSLTGTGTPTDLDIYITDPYGNIELGYNRVNTSSDPFEVLPFYVEGPTTKNIMIVRDGGNVNVRFKYIIYRGNAVIAEYASADASTIAGHANAAEAITVGAVDAAIVNSNSTLQIQSYSSLGGTRISTETSPRNKPDFAGPDAVETSVVFGNITNVFRGTSAAAPHIGAVAALLMQANANFESQPFNFSQENIRSILKQTAQPFDNPPSGYNYKSGSGFVRANEALASLYNPTPLITEWVNNSGVTPGQATMEVTIKGNYFTNGAKLYLRRDNPVIINTQFVSSTELTATIPAFLGNPEVRIFNPAKTTGNFDGGFSNSIYFLSIVKKTITIYANNASKQYGEQLPGFSVTILENGTELQKDNEGNYLASELSSRGLGTFDFTVTEVIDQTGTTQDVTKSTSPGSYPIRIEEPSINPEYFDLFEYEFNELNGSPKPGTLTITPLELTIKPKNQSFEYGESISLPIEYEYTFEGNFTDEEKEELKLEIDQQYKAIMETQKLALVDMTWNEANGIPSVNGIPVANIAMLITSKALNGIPQANGIPAVNGIPVVNVAPESITAYFASVVNGIPLANGIPVANGIPQVNGLAVANGYAMLNGLVSVNMVNGIPLANGIPVVNGIPLANGIPQVNGIVVANGLAQANGIPIANVTTVETNGLASVNGIPIANGIPVANSEVAVILDQDDLIINADGIAVVEGEYRSINMITGVNAGNHKIIPAAFITRKFKVNIQLGELEITKKAASVTPQPNSKVYGTNDPDPLTTGVLTGFDPSDNISATYSREPGESVDSYTISATLLPVGKLANYDITYNTASFTITKAAITVKANDTYANQGTAPSFSATISPALVQGDQLNISYVVTNGSGVVQSNLSNLSPGTYIITPQASHSSYDITIQTGILIINPLGGRAKAIKPVLECVTVADPATNFGYGFIARFAYINDNPTDVWVSVGPDNNITPEGANVKTDELPYIFKSGGGRFTIPFDGNTINWYLSSFEKNKKTATTSQASSTSSRCPSDLNTRVINGQAEVNLPAGKDHVYPNPVVSRVLVETGSDVTGEQVIQVLDVTGRIYRSVSVRRISPSRAELDLSTLNQGQYFIQVTGKTGRKVFRVIKL